MNIAGSSLREKIGLQDEVISRACTLAMKAHKSSSTKPYLCKKSRISSSLEIIIGFAGSWSVEDWFSHEPFGEGKINLNLFPSLRTIGTNRAATVNKAFLRRFEDILTTYLLKMELEKAVTEKKQIVFTGHSSGAPIAILAALWLLETMNKGHMNYIPPRCITFGSPLVGDGIFTHALKREHWTQYFAHFIMRHDIVPRISLASCSSIERELRPILHYFNPQSPFFSSDAFAKTAEASKFFLTVMRNASAVASHTACKFMGCTNLLLENLTNFVELSPYRPFGTYVFCTGNGKFVVIENPDGVLQILFYCLQLNSQAEWAEAAQKSLKVHLLYQHELFRSLSLPSVVNLEHLEILPLLAETMGESEDLAIDTAMNDLGLSARARLCLRAAGELEIQKFRNQSKVNSNMDKIEDVLDKLERYQADCEVRKVGYYDAFKMQKHTEDFNSNIRRLELSGIWDEIVEMLRRNELPDDFEGQKEWIQIGTRFRRLVEPLDIANYYRHLLNEDTGPYMDRARPARYRYPQKWREHAEKIELEPVSESCFWAEVEELSSLTSSAVYSEDVKERIINLERNVLRWTQSELLGKDVFLDESTFVQWWKRLPIEHTSVSVIKNLICG